MSRVTSPGTLIVPPALTVDDIVLLGHEGISTFIVADADAATLENLAARSPP